jgi:hypothetical protein
MQQRDEVSTRERERKKERKNEQGRRIENMHFSLRLHCTCTVVSIKNENNTLCMHCAFKQTTMRKNAQFPRLLLGRFYYLSFSAHRYEYSWLLSSKRNIALTHGIYCVPRKHKPFTSNDNPENKAGNYSVHFVNT